ncbi:AAA-like domain-containing protein [Rheinheimera sp. 4Y26]|uniref:AAA-like domain-containing protein n=1 Tax=Rheinheimera sp. 4Y26 TaxID=2977811 RepID=UPI0021B0E498|nr:AAA-like domain-containing protein [Rheinheimera sp. 4Y26]MCT6698038.1 AAA-like domain-containing protein [Rheinheimera sp. 4Y26]
MTTNGKVYPGKHILFKDAHFTESEKIAIESLSKEFYVTNGGEKIKLGYNSEYKYIIISPTEIYGDMFNLDREIIVVFSPYETIQARTLDVFEYVAKKHSSLRIEKICNVLVSADENIENSISDLIKNEPETQVIIPFSYNELSNIKDSFFFRNRFRKYFYTRDLFAFEAPLKKDIYFFGRADLIQELINRLKSGENAGVFGLRKTGKTSLINGIVRNLSKEGISSGVIDCQDTAFNQRSWNEALHHMCKTINETLKLNIELPNEEEFSNKNASPLTESFFKSCKRITNTPVFIIFDEIENISRNTAPASNWCNEKDFALFWQTIRSIFQRNSNLIAYLIVGTNPTCIETPKIDNVDNPIFNHFNPYYIPGFDVKDTREMTRKLGKRMGIQFDESLYAKLTEDFGGHPFLMRHVCSLIAKEVTEQERPVEVGRIAYKQGRDKFISDHSSYLEMIMGVLKESYPDEYDMLTMLANDDIDNFLAFAASHPSYTSHLVGYGILKKERESYDFNIDSIKDYIIRQSKYKKICHSQDEMWDEISKRRNSAEVKLRKLIKILLKANLGATKAKEEVLNIFGGKRKNELSCLSYDELFNASKSEIYFSDLSKIISKHWNIFSNSFDKTRQDAFRQLEFINTSRHDAHAKDITKEQFAYFRLCMESIEHDLEGAV